MSATSLEQELADLLEPALLPLRALLVGVAGIFLAFAPGSASWTSRVLLVAGCAALSIAVAWIGQSILHRWPTFGLALMEIWVLAPLAIAILASALAAQVSVDYSAPEGASTAEKARLTALATGLNGFLTAAFIAWTSSRDESRLAGRARRAFQAKYVRCNAGNQPRRGTRCVEADSEMERLVYSEDFEGIGGWGVEARWQRARRLGSLLG